MKFSRKDTLIMLAIAALGMLLRLTAILAYPSAPESDPLAYWQIASSFSSGNGLVWGDHPTAFYNLGYPVFLGTVLAVFGQSLVVAKTTNVILSALSILFIYIATLQLFKSRPAATVASILFATYTESIVFATYLAKENLMTTLLAAQIALISSYDPQSSGRTKILCAVALGIIVGTLLLTGNSTLAFLPALFIWGIRRSGTLREYAKFALIATAAATLVVAPLVYRNYVVFGAPVMNNNGGNNLYVGNFPGAGPFFPEGFPENTPLSKNFKQLYRDLGEYRMDKYMRDLAIQYILDDPKSALRRMAVRALTFWIPPIPTEGKLKSSGEAVLRFVWLAQYLIMFALFFCALAQWRRYPAQLQLLCLLLLVYALLHTPFTVGSRYRLPVMLLVAIGGGLGSMPVFRKLTTFSCSEPVR